jgi:uncharacterized protein YerC
MSIVFEAYTDNDGQVTAKLPASASFTDLANFVHAQLGLIGSLEGSQSNDGVFNELLPPLSGEFFDAAGGLVRAGLPLSVNWSSNELAPELAIFNTNLPYPSTYFVGAQTGDAQVHGALILSSLLSNATSLLRASLSPTVYFSDGYVGNDRVALLIQQPSIQSSMTPGITVALADSFGGADTAIAAFIHAIIDMFTMSDTYTTLTHALQALRDGMSLRDLAVLIHTAGLLDAFIASAVLSDRAQVTVFLKDAAAFDDTANAKSQILAAISDALYVHVTLTTGQDTYTAWVMTPETKAMRSYGNWPFNSYAQIGDVVLAAGPQGVFRLGGTADISTAIIARVRSGLLNFGTSKLKRIDRAYLGYTSSGTLCLRVCALSETGTKVEYTYKMAPQPAGGPVEGRVQVGRGPRSVYWSFELCNDATGSDFELHDISVLPMVLTGRII